MNYTLRQLNIFTEVSKQQSITKAADALFLSQPAVSIQLKKFQDQFDLPLIEVIGKKIYVTDFGERIVEAATEILRLAEEVENLNLAHTGQLIGKIYITSVSTGKYVVPFFLTDFFAEHSGVELNLDVTNKEAVVESVVSNEVDFALVSIPPDRVQHESLSLVKNKLYLVAAANLDVPKKPTHSIFDDHPLIYREEGSGTRQTMEKFLSKYNIPIKKKLELTSNEAVKQAILAGLGMSIMPLIGLKNELNLGQLKIVPIKGLPIETQWMLIWPKGKKHSPAALALLKYVQEHRADIMTNYFDWYEDYLGK